MAAFRALGSRLQAPLGAAPIHEWVMPDGAIWTRFYRTESGYLLRFPELADFEISGKALAVTCRPAPAASAATCRHLFLNQVLPLVLSRRGCLVFHASAVEVHGEAAAFLALSGRGKSTLAASFATGGHRFLSDDALVVQASGDDFLALSGHPSIRLWEDSQEALIGPDTRTAPAVQYTSKARFLAGDEITFCAEARQLRRAYFLGDGSAPGIMIERLGASEALVEWVKNSFLLDPQEQASLASHFDRVAMLANRVAAYRLDFPRRFGTLARVRHAIVEHCRAECARA